MTNTSWVLAVSASSLGYMFLNPQSTLIKPNIQTIICPISIINIMLLLYWVYNWEETPHVKAYRHMVDRCPPRKRIRLPIKEQFIESTFYCHHCHHNVYPATHCFSDFSVSMVWPHMPSLIISLPSGRFLLILKYIQTSSALIQFF
jgi:hypothetical protein